MKVPCYLNPAGSNYYAKPIPDAICVFERYIGDPAWRHFEVFVQGETTVVPAEGRPDTELVVRTASVVGNYDYLIAPERDGAEVLPRHERS